MPIWLESNWDLNISLSYRMKPRCFRIQKVSIWWFSKSHWNLVMWWIWQHWKRTPRCQMSWASQLLGVNTHIIATIRFNKNICNNKDINPARNATTRRKASVSWLALSAKTPGMSSALKKVTFSRRLEWQRSYGGAQPASDARIVGLWWATSSSCCCASAVIVHSTMIA